MKIRRQKLQPTFVRVFKIQVFKIIPKAIVPNDTELPFLRVQINPIPVRNYCNKI